DRLQLILDEADKQGLTLAHLITTIKSATDAVKNIYDKDGDFECAEPDHAQRLKAAMLGLELRAEIRGKDNKADAGVTYNTVVYNWKSAPTRILDGSGY